MGACTISGSFKSFDWRVGIEQIQERYESEYGRQEGYSGGPNCVDFRYIGEQPNVHTSKQISAFIDKRLERLNKRDGEIILVGRDGYNIISTVYREKPYDNYYKAYVVPKAPATLISYDYYGRIQVVSSGTIIAMKQLAHRKLRENKYNNCKYEIICARAKKIISCSGQVKQCKQTKRITDDKYLVLPINLYVYYGWAPE